MAAELIPLKAEQHLVTFVPKLSTDLPFFNLTSSRKNLPKVINYEGIDEAGHPIRWGVFQNASKEVGRTRNGSPSSLVSAYQTGD